MSTGITGLESRVVLQAEGVRHDDVLPVNGELVQEDGTHALRFPFQQLIAELTQHLTLEPGDVIPAGTPAGSSVVGPGDRAEVEVDHLSSGATSGRLLTTVRAGRHALGSLPSVDAT